MEQYLKATPYLDYNTPGIKAMAEGIVLELDSDIEKAQRIYKFVRDGWRYNPYNIKFEDKAMKASYIFQRTKGHCIDKAILMVSFCRLAGIPSRLRFARVKNHIATEKFEEILQTNQMVPHGIVDVFLNDKWVKCTPAFNKSLCEKLGVAVLEFDGENDSLFQEYNKADGRFMEYMEDYGHYDDVPVDFIEEIMRQYYPHIFDADGNFIATLLEG